jgi:diguanylate cyclase (GGDEF)-like protein
MKTIVIVSADVVASNLAERILSPAYKTVTFPALPSALDYIYNAIPNLIVIDIRSGDNTTIAVLNNLKEDPMFSHLPALGMIVDPSVIRSWDALFIEDYLWKKDLEQELLPRVNLAILRSERNVEINPLTRLPGNISINRQIEERLARCDTFAFAYADLDHFKPYNDKYGFSRGDDVIKITGRIILNMVKNFQPQQSFIGHIGGDDFIYIMDVAYVEKASQEIIRAFDDIIPTFYDPEDRNKGYIEAVDRQGTLRTFPVIGISIGITDTEARQFSHYGELTERASEMKKFAKQAKGSIYRVDKRTARLALAR